MITSSACFFGGRWAPTLRSSFSLDFYSFEGGPGPVEMARPDAGIPPDVRSVPLSNLTAEDLVHVRLEEMEFYTSDTMGPFVIVEDSERARTALEERLGPS